MEETLEKVALQIDGMSCGHCVAGVKKALDVVEGAQVEIGSASVAFDPARASLQQIARAVEEAGYAVRPVAGA